MKRPTIYLWVRQGLLPCYRVGKRLIKFDEEELLASFKIERIASPPPKVEVGTRPPGEPFRALGRAESHDAKKRKERYRAMIGVVE